MKLICAGTGSDGNTFAVIDEDRILILDAGISMAKTLPLIDYRVADIDSVLVTHRHLDHARYAKEYTKRGIAVYTNPETVSYYGHGTRPLKSNKWSQLLGGWKVCPFYVPHDTDAPCYAFIVKAPSGKSLIYATDFEYLPFTFKAFNVDLMLLACNHDDEVTETEDNADHFDHIVRGHSSLSVVKDAVRLSKGDKLKSVVLCHLSDSNASEGHIRSEMASVVGENVRVTVAHKGDEITI